MTLSRVQVPVDLSSRCVKRFFDDFLGLNDFMSPGGSIRAPLADLILQSRSLHHAVLAVGALFSTYRNVSAPSASSSNFRSLTYSSYSAAVVSTRKDILEQSPNYDALLWTSFLLSYFELMSTTIGDSWLTHMKYGMSTIARLRGPKICLSSTAASRDFFLTFRWFELSRALLYVDTTFLAESEWITTMKKAIDPSKKGKSCQFNEQLFGATVDTAVLRVE